ncbi:2-oxoglutarate synthase [candidate division WOR-1 bacterium RIFCSPHIGHO2_02_FULL_53_26]|nr:MAG: 2-oxoglutarate synthase [candidate division WOR-1 bacterium RIFCSPHIGHO2_02_FULL_53_26]
MDIETHARNDWCPGCGNFAILNAVKAVLAELQGEGASLDDVVLVGGIGQHAKMLDYINVNSFYSLHGRPLPPAEGIKLANPKTKVIVFSGDGDAYGEGIEHLIFAAKRNIDITLIVHDNRVYALTTGQVTPTSPQGFKSRSIPSGNLERPINPLELILAAGATHIARGYSANLPLLKRQIKEAILHKGFSLIDVLQVCVTFNNLYDYYSKHVYELKDHDPADREAALKKMREWDYNTEAPIALGTFYKASWPTFDELFLKGKGEKDEPRSAGIKELLKNYI